MVDAVSGGFKRMDSASDWSLLRLRCAVEGHDWRAWGEGAVDVCARCGMRRVIRWDAVRVASAAAHTLTQARGVATFVVQARPQPAG